jgi:hypothetical protein
MVTWYTDMKAMQEDDAFLQKVYTELRHDLSPEAKKNPTRARVSFPSMFLYHSKRTHLFESSG